VHNNSSTMSFVVIAVAHISSLEKPDLLPEQLPKHGLW